MEPVRLFVSVLTLVALAALAGALGADPQAAEAAPLDEVKKLLASDAAANNDFGHGVAVDGNIAVVGAPLGNGVSGTGAAYVFERNQGGPGNWGQVKKLIAADAEAGDFFGGAVAASGDTAIVGAMQEDAGGINAGAAYVFQRNQGGAGNWGEVKKLIASDAQAVDVFGGSVAVSGDTAIVGASGEDAGGTSAGAAYVFQRNQGGTGNWGEVKKLTASDASANDAFGAGVAIDGDTALVGAYGEDSGGAVYIFQRNQGGAGNWGQVKKITASDIEALDSFGYSVAIDGDTAVVGAPAEDAGGAEAGAAYVFERDQGGANNWGQVKKLTASDAGAGDMLGFSVAASGDTAIAGAQFEDAGGLDAGAAYVFQRDVGGAGNWGEIDKLTASDAEPGDFFGRDVAVSGVTALLGAYREDAGGSNAGAAYVFAECPDSDGDVVCDGVDNCPLWSNPAQNTPPWSTPPNDSDCDGFTDAAEGTIGTDPADNCPDNPADDAWPSDFDMNTVINVSDVFQVLPPHFGTAVPPTSARRDLAPDGVINISDVFMVLPPFFGWACT